MIIKLMKTRKLSKRITPSSQLPLPTYEDRGDAEYDCFC